MTVNITDLKAFLHLSETDKDSLLDEVLAATLEIVGDMVDASLETGARAFTVRPNGHNLVLPMTHLDVTQPVIVTDPHGRELTPAEVDVNHLSGIVTVRRAVPGAWKVSATPREGSAAIDLAVKIIAGHLWEVQRVRGGVRGAVMGGADDAPSGVGFAIPRRAAQLLKPYLRL